ncbi:MAG: hypothetical protein AB7N91_22335 [Candidatus Tectimicrobiota bacterium]
MPGNERYKIPKTLRQVTLWVHPEGPVVGSLFLSLYTKNSLGAEDPATVMNEATPFLVLRQTDPEEFRFYNKKAIIRVEYPQEEDPPEEGMTTLYCQMTLMDGSYIEGMVRCVLPPDHARLYDYLNLAHEQFAKLHLEDGRVCLVNKAYVMSVAPLTPQARAEPRYPSDAVEIDEMSV